MNDKSDTPETDNNEYGWQFNEQYDYFDSLSDTPLPWADFARKLERERNAMIKLNEILCQFMNDELKMSLADPRLIKLQSIVAEKIKKPDAETAK